MIIMGIKKYINNLIELFPDIIIRQKPNTIEILAFDINTILHEIIVKTVDKELFKNELYSRLNNIVNKFHPKVLGIFVDGQSINSKIFTQIKRRQKTLYSDNNNSLNLTNGTLFMDYIDSIITNYINQLKNIKCYYSSSKEHNEGELKLFDWLKQYSNKTICIVGKDADLIVLSLISTPLLYIYIYNNKTFINIYVLIEKLSSLCELQFNLKYHPIRKDAVLLSFLLGNDYLPNISSFKSIFKEYKKFLSLKRGFLYFKDGNLNLNNLKYILSKLPMINDTLYPKQNVYHYFNSILWNMDLYQGKVYPNYLPEININLHTIIKYFPKYITINYKQDKTWLESDIYLLLVMPITGKTLIPTRLQKYMEPTSPIIDLFPKPCPICIGFKEKISKLNAEMETMDKNIFREQINIVNQDYTTHIEQCHTITKLPIDRIRNTIVQMD